MTGGVITVRAGNPNDPGLPPFQETGDGSENYINVGTGLIAEAVSYQIETFDGNIIDDRSRPTNNYLPAGTVDYCSRSTVMDAGSGFTYRVLRYGKRVYTCLLYTSFPLEIAGSPLGCICFSAPAAWPQDSFRPCFSGCLWASFWAFFQGLTGIFPACSTCWGPYPRPPCCPCSCLPSAWERVPRRLWSSSSSSFPWFCPSGTPYGKSRPSSLRLTGPPGCPAGGCSWI